MDAEKKEAIGALLLAFNFEYSLYGKLQEMRTMAVVFKSALWEEGKLQQYMPELDEVQRRVFESTAIMRGWGFRGPAANAEIEARIFELNTEVALIVMPVLYKEGLCSLKKDFLNLSVMPPVAHKQEEAGSEVSQ